MNLRQIIVDRGLKQKWVAGQIGITESHFSEVVRGIRKLPLEKVEPLAVLLKVSIEDVVRAAARKTNGSGCQDVPQQ